MLTKIYSASIQGIDAFPVTIETSGEKGATFSIVGMPDTAVKESQQRIVSAISHSGISFPHRRTIINLAPADVKKEGAAFDLPMALGVLTAHEIVPATNLSDYMIMGELSLDGSVLPVRGVLPMAIKARELGFKKLIVPEENVTEAAVVNKVEVYGVKSLGEAVSLLSNSSDLKPTVINTREIFASRSAVFDLDFSEVKGQESVKRALEVACAGGHNLLMVGPPGAGKSMMAKRVPTILPPLSLGEALETTKIHSVAGKLSRGAMLMTKRPFRTPHPTVSSVAMVGGGTNPMPGEISLAHNGVLFLDEFPEFPRSVLEVLRQPIEDRVITVARAKYTVNYPASFMLVASMNPCPCGYYGHPTKFCTCLPGAVNKYMNKISGPLMDRIDIQIEIQPVAFDDIANTTPAESSASIRDRVIKARLIQQERFRSEKGIYNNSQMNTRMLRKYAWPDSEGLSKLKAQMEKKNLSARAFDRILRVSRTIADLESAIKLPADPSSEEYKFCMEEAVKAPVKSHHISEAINYRNLDRSDYGTSF